MGWLNIYKLFLFVINRKRICLYKILNIGGNCDDFIIKNIGL